MEGEADVQTAICVIYTRRLQNVSQTRIIEWKPPLGKGRCILETGPEAGKPKGAVAPTGTKHLQALRQHHQ